jgi:hypothetical protein
MRAELVVVAHESVVKFSGVVDHALIVTVLVPPRSKCCGPRSMGNFKKLKLIQDVEHPAADRKGHSANVFAVIECKEECCAVPR